MLNMKIKSKINYLLPLLLLIVFSAGVLSFLSSANFFIIENLNKVDNFTNELSKNMDSVSSLSKNINNEKTNEIFINEKKENVSYSTFRDSSIQRNNKSHDIFEGMDDYAKNNTIFTNWNNSLDLEHSKNAFYATGILPKEELKRCKSHNLNLDPKLDCYCYNLVNITYNDTVFNIAADGRFTFMTNCTNMSNMSFKIEVNNIYFFIKKYFTVNIFLPLSNSTNKTVDNMTNETITNITNITNK
jgi:hypothetical protein